MLILAFHVETFIRSMIVKHFQMTFMISAFRNSVHSKRFLRIKSSGSGEKKFAHPTVYFSGIQPTGVPHLGNYFGFIKPWLAIQEV